LPRFTGCAGYLTEHACRNENPLLKGPGKLQEYQTSATTNRKTFFRKFIASSAIPMIDHGAGQVSLASFDLLMGQKQASIRIKTRCFGSKVFHLSHLL
jgi:hypothetical protein